MAKSGALLSTTFHEYTIIRQIEQGGAGVVCEARRDDDVVCAIKVLRDVDRQSSRVSRFKNEMAFCSTQRHRNIIHIIDSGFIADGGSKRIFYVMPLYNETLRKAMRKLSRDKIVGVFSQLLDGVEAAHLHGVWHRDLKPENILVDQAGCPVVADFGIAHFHETHMVSTVDTSPAERLANFQYAAPEQRLIGAVVDHRADIYALGLILNEMFTGVVPHGSGYATIGNIDPAYAYLDGIVERMIQQSPTARPSSINDVKSLFIAHRNECVIRQRLDALNREVVSAATVDDPLVKQPVRIVQKDYRNGCLEFQLSSAPNADWHRSFQRIDYGTCLLGRGPTDYTLSGGIMRISASETEARRVVQDTERFVNLANTKYSELRTRQAKEKERQEAERLAIAREEEERRLRVLRSIQ